MKWSSKRPLFNFIFPTERLCYLNEFLPKYMDFNLLKWSGTLKVLPSLHNAKNQLYEEKGFECIIVELMNRWFLTRLADLKNHQTHAFLRINYFL